MKQTQSSEHLDALLSLVQQLKAHYQAPPPEPAKRGRRREYSSLAFLLLAAVAVTLHTFQDSELHRLLSSDERLRRALEFSRVPHRTTIGRRLASMVPEAEAQIAALGRVLLAEVEPGEDRSQLSAIDGRMYEASGPQWHGRDRRAGVIPQRLRAVDTESAWSRSGYRGWVQGYRLLLQGLTFPAPVPIFAAWRRNDEGESVTAEQALSSGQMPVTSVLLGDTTFGKAPFTHVYEQAGGWVLTSRQLPKHRRSWKNDLYEYRKETIELLFQRIIQAADLKRCQVLGFGRNGAFVLASVWIYQVCFLNDYRAHRPLAHVKEHIECARWRLVS
jgi:hypothetical protein